ncbi:PREDICTED: Golgi integral membrane protein 4-like isoform X4 [Crocodylus porosus]|uniref:Golgi integral membrane protein 4-like isoform X4 n=1 Tax=Crocodylus porosus TaxID=8502 RepID=UPI00093F9CAD|nr:PREDICTED: Golgi integral membrane protein 4-like isoform X4 [Crocodylus porosus]
MGTGMCSRRQKGLLQTGFCLAALACLGAGAFLYGHLQRKVRGAEALALKHRQQQEALSAQLQVVYEHRSRLERSLQKERGEHKKTKEDFLVYKLEAQEALNKEKQDSMNRYGALSSQHKILKNQHEDVKKQLLDLQLQHNSLKLEHRKVLETHNQKYSQLQREKENEVTNLQDTVFKLREESKLLRKAHQEVHSQLLNAQTQMEEFRQLKEALQKMPSFKEVGAAKGQQSLQALKEQPVVPGSSPLQLARQKDQKVGMGSPGRKNEENQPPGGGAPDPKRPSTLEKAQTPENRPSAGNKHVQMQSWQDIVNKVNAQMDEEQVHNYPKSLRFDTRPEQAMPNGNLPLPNQKRGAEPHIANQEAEKERTDDEELEMDAGMIEREENLNPQKDTAAQEPMLPDDAADPAQDPNNQGEDEFEEAELERPDFEEKPGDLDKFKEHNRPVKEGTKEKPAQEAVAPEKDREDPLDEYQEDQEQEIEDHGGEVDDNDDLELVQQHKDHAGLQGAGGRKDDYY